MVKKTASAVPESPDDVNTEVVANTESDATEVAAVTDAAPIEEVAPVIEEQPTPVVEAPTISENIDCDYCSRTGLLSPETLCPKCNGTGIAV